MYFPMLVQKEFLSNKNPEAKGLGSWEGKFSEESSQPFMKINIP